MPLPSRSARCIPLVALLLLLPTAAAAQIGGVINKGKKKATEVVPGATTEDRGCTAPKFDKDMLELTADRIDRVMKGVKAMRAGVGPSGKSADQLAAQANAAFEERDKLLEGKDEQIARYEEAESRSRDCHWAALDSMKNLHGQQAQQRLMAMAASQDAAALQGVLEAQTKASEAAAAGDTAGANKALADFYRQLGFDFVKDTADADRLCKKPVKPAWMVRADSLGRLGNALVEEAQALTAGAIVIGAEAAGMEQRQLAIAQERINAFLQSDGAPSASWCYSPAEREALKAKMKELRAMDFQ